MGVVTAETEGDLIKRFDEWKKNMKYRRQSPQGRKTVVVEA